MQAIRQPLRVFSRSSLTQTRSAGHHHESALREALNLKAERQVAAADFVKLPEFNGTHRHLAGRTCKVIPALDDFWPVIRCILVFGPVFVVPKICVGLWDE